MVILTLNCGSSSAKYQVYDWNKKAVLAVGVVERIGLDYSLIEHKAVGKQEFHDKSPCPTHKEAIELIIKLLLDKELGVIANVKEIGAVGHRVLHGGELFKKSALVDDDVVIKLKELIPLGPLHMPANIMGIEAARKVMPDIPHAIVMDTAWHQTMPASAFMYAVPYEWYTTYNVRRYGFHGTSFIYTAKRASVLLGREPKDTNLIICHIGNGASVSAVRNGVCVDTSMGLTPLEGLVMGTRSGDLDPAILPFIMNRTGLSPKEMDTTLNKKSGLMGICGMSDRRDVLKSSLEGNERAQLAIDMECHRLKKYIGAYSALLGKVDALVFTAGVGEMAPHIRLGSAKGLDNIGIKLDLEKNRLAQCRNAELAINTDDSPVKIFVIPTDEELVMTEDAYALVHGTYDVHINFTYSFQHKDYVNKAREEGLTADLAKRPELIPLIARPL
ncbi:MAG: acetate kinase [Sphaerochaetaceae bacterium]|jgi:acetate kinase|nr:acetate kinase [Sphaerochaetaceae bacterium]NLO59850.1 acetate kinase [Spirochaetales bacterium]MDD2406283.1 acetate kinase [Sphaerochaetaceae bacterium]MDD3670675.1 acetate kinase [Sphaerochaetaceae bacterium]MDD4260216.1 acetate kinase [Sphaerochaetaceae bacterium]